MNVKFVSWQPVLTDHQSYTLEFLGDFSQTEVKVFVASMEHSERKKQGWLNKHSLILLPTLIPKKGWLRYSYTQLKKYSDAVHLFGSPFEHPKLILVLILASIMKVRIYLISEPYSELSYGYQRNGLGLVGWLKSKIRPYLYSFYGAILSKKVRGVFAISCLAVKQYRKIGFPAQKIFPFGYFIPQNTYPLASEDKKFSLKKNLRVVFVGNLIDRKGLDILISAANALSQKGFEIFLDVYGPGNPSKYFFDGVNIRYCGLIDFGFAQSVISKYDLLVLPSRFDGWGVVVNEAILAGVPAVCSDQVGASALIKKWNCGDVFVSEDKFDLQLKLERLIHNPRLLAEMQKECIKAGRSIQPEIAGEYIWHVVRASENNVLESTIECPWYEC